MAISNWYQLKTKRSRLKDLYTNNPQELYLKNPGLGSSIMTPCCYTEQNFYRGSTELKALSKKILYLFYPLSSGNPKCHIFDSLDDVLSKKKYISAENT